MGRRCVCTPSLVSTVIESSHWLYLVYVLLGSRAGVVLTLAGSDHENLASLIIIISRPFLLFDQVHLFFFLTFFALGASGSRESLKK